MNVSNLINLILERKFHLIPHPRLELLLTLALDLLALLVAFAIRSPHANRPIPRHANYMIPLWYKTNIPFLTTKNNF